MAEEVPPVTSEGHAARPAVDELLSGVAAGLAGVVGNDQLAVAPVTVPVLHGRRFVFRCRVRFQVGLVQRRRQRRPAVPGGLASEKDIERKHVQFRPPFDLKPLGHEHHLVH